MSERGFNFYVGGIEDAMVAALKAACPYARDVATYSGELDEKNLREALDELLPRFPLFLVTYNQGDDVFQTGLGPGIHTPRSYRHDCSFTVVCCSDDARGSRDRRRGGANRPGVWQMIDDAQDALSRIQFVAVVEDEKIILNHEPLNPAGVQYLAHLPELTAYAVTFSTYFVYATPDRSGGHEFLVEEIEIELFPSTKGSNTERPGVVSS